MIFMKSNSISVFRILVGLLLTLYTATAQHLSKEEAVRLALEHNFGIRIAQNTVAIADNNTRITNTGYLPSIAGDAGATYQRSRTITSFPDAVTQDGTPRGDDRQIGQETQRYNAGLNLDYVLFDGLGRYYNYKRLKEQYNLSELQARETIENTIVQLFTVYYEIARLAENKKVLQEILNISKQRVTRATYQFEYGQTTKLGVLNAQVDVANDSVAMLNVQQQLANAKRDLNVILNQALDRRYTVDTTLAFIAPLRLQDYIATYKEYNATLLRSRSNLAISAYDVKVQKSGYLPVIGLNGQYGWNQSRNPPRAFFPANISNAASLSAGITLRWNFFDSGRTWTAVKNAKIAERTQEYAKQQLELEVDRDLKNAQEMYANRMAIYTIEQQNVLTNQHNFDRSAEQFKLGQITSIAFRQAQLNLQNAKTNKNTAKYNAKLAELQVLQLTGRLLSVEF